MSAQQRQQLILRLREIEAELAAVSQGRAVDGDHATLESELQQAREELEFTLAGICAVEFAS